jgi:hypothetical protein
MSVVTCPGPGGKTVLLRSWIGQAGAARLSERVAWVPAGHGERDPQRIWLSMLTALRQTAPGLAAGAGGDGGAGPWTAERSLRFVLATRHDVRRRADVQAQRDRVCRGFDWQKQPTADPHTPIPKCVAAPPGRRHRRTPPYCAPDGSR